MSKPPRHERPLHWVGSYKRDLLALDVERIHERL